MRPVLRFLRRHQLALWASFFATLVLSAGAIAGTTAKSGGGGKIYACIAGDHKTLNYTSASKSCPDGQRMIAWNTTGSAGKTGTRGPKGASGPAGPKGDAGSPGAAGPIGATGPAGSKGDAGDTGPAGPKGNAGADGETGPAGSKGDAGDAGPAGPNGNTGPTGPKGDTGDTGPAGTNGSTGEQGPPGPPLSSSYAFARSTTTVVSPDVVLSGQAVRFDVVPVATGITVGNGGSTFTVDEPGVYELDFLGVAQTDVFYAIQVNGVAQQPQVESTDGQVLVQQLVQLALGDTVTVVPVSGLGVISGQTLRILRVAS